MQVRGPQAFIEFQGNQEREEAGWQPEGRHSRAPRKQGEASIRKYASAQDPGPSIMPSNWAFKDLYPDLTLREGGPGGGIESFLEESGGRAQRL